MKSQLIAIVAAVVLVGCGESQQSVPAPEAKPVEPVAQAATSEPSTAKTPDISIHKAAERGNIEAVKQHLDTGADVNVKSDSGMTPLHHAAYRENNEVIELLIAKGASVNAQDVAGRTPLNVAIRYKRTKSADLLRKHGGKTSNWLNADDSIHSAASAGHIEAVKQHLANGVDVNAKTKSGFTPLDTAIRRNHPETADLLRTHGGKSGAEYSIHVAAELGNIEAVKQHLNAGTDVDARDEADKTPLPHAAYWGHKEIVELLIAKGANVNARDRRGSTPLNWANESRQADKSRQAEIADLIRKHGGKIFKRFSALDNKETFIKTSQPEPLTAKTPDSSIHDAAEKGNIEVVKQHLAAGADANAKDHRGGTPLQFAVGRGRKDIIELLIAKGADVNVKFDGAGLTPLHMASGSGRYEIVELLIDKGAKMNTKDSAGRTALDWAEKKYDWPEKIMAAKKETVDLLRKHGGKTGEELKAEGK